MTTVMTACHLPATPAAVAALVRSCSPESLGERFASPHRLAPEDVLDRYPRYLLGGAVAVAAWTDGRVAGLLNLAVVRPGVVDVALLVADDLQRRGVATGLFATTLADPRWQGWTVEATIRPENRAGLGFLRAQRLGRPRLAGMSVGQLTYAIEVPTTAVA
ncbi:GNAT family N-acetyltransferase [Pseudonocardia dioxanivorans]|uniref:GNAT family N-acetyltransferase n=2 Tax=Pseudonocardia dioxanivorans TaxID=240495 RepID=UPI00104B66D1|nr:N-acetyltransferase [Pseudonocardia dioxanivorans]